MHRTITAACAATIVLISTSALADDSSAALGMGGLVLTRNDSIRMATEDLRISPNDVKVRYAFINDSAKDIDTIVAFPLPDIDLGEYSESPLGTVKNESPNFVGFKLVVDGHPVAATAEERAMIKNRDVSDLVRKAGLPINMAGTNLYEVLPKLPMAQRKALVAAGLLDIEGSSGPDLKGDQFHPQWVARTKFWWHQRFPAGKTVVIEHSYQPVTGQSFFGSSALATNEDGAYYRKNYCLDAPTRAAIGARLDARKKKNADNPYLIAYATDFILKTANNWKGGIGQFRLTVDKLKPENIVSFCWDGDVKKTGPATFEASADHFAPKRDIQVLVLQDTPSQQ
jgi:hypothetical protein